MPNNNNISLGNHTPIYFEKNETDKHNRGHIQKPDVDPELKIHRNMGKHFTSFGNGKYSVGLNMSKVLKFTLSTPFRWVGNKIQNGHDFTSSKFKIDYLVGAGLKGIGNITGGTTSVIGNSISVMESGVSNSINMTSKAFHNDLKGNDFNLKNKQEPLRYSGAKEVLEKAKLTNFVCTDYFNECPKGLVQATSSDIPKTVLVKGLYTDSKSGNKTEKSTGKVLKLRIDKPSKDGLTTLSGDSWSALKVGVFKTDSEPKKIALVFVGTAGGSRIATVKSDLSSAIGIKDSAIQNASKLVQEFVKEYGKDNVEVMGHSLGGGLAQYSGIRNEVKVTAFNAMGINLNLRNKLGNEKLNNSNVTLINNYKDVLSQYVEAGRFGVDSSSQVGKRYQITKENSVGKTSVEQHFIDNLYLSIKNTVESSLYSDYQKKQEIVNNITKGSNKNVFDIKLNENSEDLNKYNTTPDLEDYFHSKDDMMVYMTKS